MPSEHPEDATQVIDAEFTVSRASNQYPSDRESLTVVKRELGQDWFAVYAAAFGGFCLGVLLTLFGLMVLGDSSRYITHNADTSKEHQSELKIGNAKNDSAYESVVNQIETETATTKATIARVGIRKSSGWLCELQMGWGEEEHAHSPLPWGAGTWLGLADEDGNKLGTFEVISVKADRFVGSIEAFNYVPEPGQFVTLRFLSHPQTEN